MSELKCVNYYESSLMDKRHLIWGFKGCFSGSFPISLVYMKDNSLLTSFFSSLIDVSTHLLYDFGQFVVLK